jgi:MscS family membrane protein
MIDYLTSLYLGNEFVRAAIILIVAFIVVRTAFYIVKKVLPRFTAKTNTTLDDDILDKVSFPLSVLAVLFGIRIAINQITIARNLGDMIGSILLTMIIIVGGVVAHYLIDSLLIIGFTRVGKKIKAGPNESLIQFFESIIKIVVIAGVLLIMLASWGIEIKPLLAGLGVAGIAIAFALQSTLSNIFGGISMLIDKSINTGDVIKLDDGTGGKILKINLRSTKIKTFDNELIIVPNGKLSESNIQNVALPEPMTRVVVPFGVAYGANIDKVKKIVLKELNKVNEVVHDPEPSVKFIEMADSSLNFKAYFYIESFNNRLSALDEANTLIYNALNREKIEIPFPQLDVHSKK